MTILELIFLSLSLAGDAFAVSICKGISFYKNTKRNALIVGLWFGVFQALMTTLGYFLGRCFTHFVFSVDHWIAFFLLSFIGINMILEYFHGDSELDGDVGFKIMFLLAIATSIDAFAVGITLAFLNINIFVSSSLIGIITLFLSFIGCFIGRVFGNKYGNVAELFGGVVLIIIGLKILLTHLYII